MVKVVDASFLLSFLVPDESADKGEYEDLILGKVGLIAPGLLRFEVGNALLLASRRKRLTAVNARKIIRLFDNLPIGYKEVNLPEVFLLADKFNLTIYDASYVWLARKLKADLLTHDKEMREAAMD